MLNWRNSDEYKRILPALRPGEEVDMPDIATGAFKVGNMKLQLRHNQYELEALEIHKKLLAMGWDLPQIKEVRKASGNLYTFVEWWEGETGLELRERVKKIPLDYYRKLGHWVGKLHTTKVDGKSVSVLNYWPRNTLIRPDGSVVYIDLNKLYYTDYVQARIEECIVAETPTVSRDQAEAFLSTYREHLPYDPKEIFRWHLKNLAENWHSVYLDGELFYEGKTDFRQRWAALNLPEDFSGLYVLDLGYGEGMFALEAAKRGAKRVYAIDNRNMSVGQQRYRMSDYGKLLSVYHGFDENRLLYKHMDIDTDWFIDKHMIEDLNYIPDKKWDIVFALNITKHLKPEKQEKFENMLPNIGKRVVYEP